jgi:hypothetical protein
MTLHWEQSRKVDILQRWKPGQQRQPVQASWDFRHISHWALIDRRGLWDRRQHPWAPQHRAVKLWAEVVAS